jgi:hypothetical protein
VRLRLTKIDEYQFLTCLKHGLWGSKSARFKTWREADRLAIIVDKSLAALAEVTGEAFISRDKVWDNGLFPHRIRLKFTHVLQPKDRPPILGEVRDAMTQQWGPRYGWAILNQQVLESPHADIVAKAISSKPNALQDYQQNLVNGLEEARIKRERFAKVSRNVTHPLTLKHRANLSRWAESPGVLCGLRQTTKVGNTGGKILQMTASRNCRVWASATKPQGAYP